jgi:hypothetical protein
VEEAVTTSDLVVAIEEGYDRYGTDFVVAWKRM